MPAGLMKHAGALALGWLASAGAQSAGATPPPPRLAVIGMNAPQVQYGMPTMPFANLVIGSEWVDPHWALLSDEHQDKDGTLRSAPAEGYAQRFLSLPLTGPAGIEVRCTFSGSGSLSIFGGGTPISSGPGSLRFRVVNQASARVLPWLIAGKIDPARPLRDLDCRQTGLTVTARFRPEFLATLRGYGVIRFMDWQNANENKAVRWAERHGANGNRVDVDGVSIEDMLALARELSADPWFVMPWNADTEYLANFAKLVHERLPAGRHVYVEVGNEVWNGGFAVARQAVAEGRQRGLGGSDMEAGMRRYAQRTAEVMPLWEAVFAGADRARLVRVLSTQHVYQQTAQVALGYGDVAAHVDALATAPYFGTTFGGTGNTREAVLAHLSADITTSLKDAVANRRIAAGFGKRYIGYEGGEGLALPAQPALGDQLQHDPAQYNLYRRYLAEWRRDVGDTLCLLTSVAPVGPGGAWGLAITENETPAQAPKLRAVRDDIAGR